MKTISMLLPAEDVRKVEDVAIPAGERSIPARVYWPDSRDPGDGYGLPRQRRSGFQRAYAGHQEDERHPYLSPLHAKIHVHSPGVFHGFPSIRFFPQRRDALTRTAGFLGEDSRD